MIFNIQKQILRSETSREVKNTYKSLVRGKWRKPLLAGWRHRWDSNKLWRYGLD